MYSSITSRLFSNQAIKSANGIISIKMPIFFQATNRSGLLNVLNKSGQHNNRVYSTTLKPRAQQMYNEGLRDLDKLYPEDHMARDYLATEYYNLMAKCPHMSVKDLIGQITQFPEEGDADQHYIRATKLEKAGIFDDAAESYAAAKEFNPEKYGEIVDKRIPSLIEKFNEKEKERIEYVKKRKEQLLKEESVYSSKKIIKAVEQKDESKLKQEKQKDIQKEINRSYRPSYI